MKHTFHNSYILFILSFFYYQSAASTHASEKAAHSCKLIFKNSNQITAKFSHCTEKRIYFTTDYLTEETSVKLSLLKEIKLTSDLPPTKPNAQHRAHLTLNYIHPSDELRKIKEQISGVITNITDKDITISTNFSKPVTVPQKIIAELTLEDTSITLFEQPHDIKSWHRHQNTNHWKIENYNLISSGPDHISKDIKLSSLNRLSFSLENIAKKNYNNLTLHLFSNQPSDNPEQLPCHYELRVLNTSATLKKLSNGHYSKLNKTYPPRLFKTGNLHTIDIYSDLKKGKFYLYGNNKLLITYTDPNPDPSLFGSSLHLISYGQPQKITHLKSSKWNGTHHSASSAKDSKPPRLFSDPIPNGKNFILKNGDIIHGVLKKFDKEILEIQTQIEAPGPQSSTLPTTLRVPLRGLRHLISNQTNSTTTHQFSANTIQATFKNGDKIFLNIKSIKGNTLHAIHPVLGKIECDIRAFIKLQFTYEL